MSTDRYTSPLSERYASKEMQYIFSQDKKFSTWRRLWIALAETEMELGLSQDGKPVIIALADLVFHGEMQLDPGNCPVRIFQAEAPHTNDSTLVEVPSEKVLILGDCTGGVFPTWEMDEELAGKLAETIRLIQPEICLPGHWTPLDPEIVIQDLLDGNG